MVASPTFKCDDVAHVSGRSVHPANSRLSCMFVVNWSLYSGESDVLWLD